MILERVWEFVVVLREQKCHLLRSGGKSVEKCRKYARICKEKLMLATCSKLREYQCFWIMVCKIL